MHLPRASSRFIAVSIAVSVAALISSCSTPSVDGTAPPYDPTSLTNGSIYHWPVGDGIALYIVPGGSADAALRAAVAESVSRWSDALAYREHTFRIVDSPSAADMMIRDAATPSPVETSACSGSGWTDATATTFFCPLGDSARTLDLLSGDQGHVKVLITVDIANATDQDALIPVVLHELGHALGIGGHSPNAFDAMFAAPAAHAPSTRDARTLRYLLHRRPDVTL